MTRKAETIVMTALLVAVYCPQVQGQVTPGAILQVDVENLVDYRQDTSDLSRFATDPNVTMPVLPRNFYSRVLIGDIVAVNGQRVKGTVTRSVRVVLLRTEPNPGEAIADTLRGSVGSDVFEFLQSDGTPIGTIFSYGLHDGSPPPGAPLSLTSTNFAIIGGTGAFLGARGQSGKGTLPQPVPTRIASVMEDPAYRRINRGATARFVIHVIPMSRPEVVVTTTGPAIFHADFSPVSSVNPAQAGEVLIVRATGLGATRPGVDPGQPLPVDASQEVNSPVEVTVNGQSADAINKVGWPGQVDTYRVDFRVPDGITTGTAAIQLTVAWIPGPPVNIPIQ